MFKNRVLKGIFGLKRDGVVRVSRKQHHVELRDLYSSPSITRISKSKRVELARLVAGMGLMNLLVS
jgi:hypothetical protein